MDNLDPKLLQAFAAAFDRGDAVVAAILRGAEMATHEDMAQAMGCSSSDLDQRREGRTVLALRTKDGELRYPRWQIGESGTPFAEIPGLFELCGDEAWAVFRFLTREQPALEGLTGSAALRRGMGREVLSACESEARGDFT